MKLLGRKLCSLSLGGLLAFSMVGCGSSSTSTNASAADNSAASNEAASTEASEVDYDAIEKPEKITMMVNGNFVNVASGQAEVVKKYKELTGIDLVITTVDHNSYNDQLALAFAAGDVPDVVILSSDFYAAYAAQGALADISSYWDASEAKNSGRFSTQYIDSLYIDDSLYGFAAQRGNGCLTYLRQDWLDNLGLSVPTTYDEYLNVLRAFTNSDPDGNGLNDTYGVTAPGLIGAGSPYISYLPEFWQDSFPGLYENEEGVWVDGFTEQSTVDALQRMKDAYAEGVIDVEVTTNKTSSCRDKFYSGKVGAFTYWAGKWSKSLEENLQAINPDAKLVAIPPIAELGLYPERQTPAIAITSNCKNPGGVFKYLFDFMVDGAEGQMLFTYGVEGVHYEVKDGVYTQLPNIENPSTTFTCVYIDPLLALSTWVDEDPFATTRDAGVEESNKLFVENSKIAPMVVSNDTIANYASSLTDICNVIVADVVTGSLSVEDGMKQYQDQAGAMIEEMLASLN